MSNIVDLAKYRKAKSWAALKKRLESGEPIAIRHPGGWWKFQI